MYRLGATVVLALLAPVTTYGQNGTHGTDTSVGKGRIEGRVVDGQTGQPLVGGQVVVATVEIGTVTRPDGTFFIDDVPAGGQRVTSEYLGYRSMSREVDVVSGRTVEVEFPLRVDVVEADAILATYEREPMRRRVSRRAIEADPVAENLELPDRVRLQCEGDRRYHGAIIVNGRWSDYETVKGMRCESPRTGPRPVGIITREDAKLLTEEQKAEFARRGYLIRGYNDEEFSR